VIFYKSTPVMELAITQFYVHVPPIQIGPKDSITWSCTFGNNPAPLPNPENPQTCTYQAQYYPADPKNPDLIEVGN
jgi:hypothetical protein